MKQPILLMHDDLVHSLSPHFSSYTTLYSIKDFLSNSRFDASNSVFSGIWVTQEEWEQLKYHEESLSLTPSNLLNDDLLRVRVLLDSPSMNTVNDTSSWAKHALRFSQSLNYSLSEIDLLLIQIQVERCIRLQERSEAALHLTNIRESLVSLTSPLRALSTRITHQDGRVYQLLKQSIDHVEHARQSIREANQSEKTSTQTYHSSSQSLRAMIIEVLEDLLCPVSWLSQGPDFEVKVDSDATRRALSLLISGVAQVDKNAKLSLAQTTGEEETAELEVFVRSSSLNQDSNTLQLDLAYIRQVAELQEGVLNFQSTISGDLKITWRFTRASMVEDEQEAGQPSALQRSLIWLIDDEAGVRVTVKRWLTHLGYQVEVFEEGVALLETITQQRSLPALIICDADMPGMTGLEVLSSVSQLAPQVKRLLYTAREPSRWVIEAFNQGLIHRFIDKSQGPESLKQCLEELLQEQEERGQQLQALDELLDQRLIQLFLQPIFCAQTRVIEASEALMRSKHPRFRGPLDILEATQLAQKEFELQKLLTSLSREIREELPSNIKLFMNIDPIIFGQPDRLDEVFDEVYPYASSIVLELTERGQLCGNAWVESVNYLRGRGFEIALDDLGAGYNSLGAVAAVSPEIIKLDISLVSNLHSSSPKREMVRLLSEYALRHQIKTVAEGIELAEEAAVCTELGIKWLQGYHLERPIPMETYRAAYHQSPEAVVK